MVFIHFAVAGSSLQGVMPSLSPAFSSVPSVMVSCDREGAGCEVRCSDGKFLPSGSIWSTKAPITHAAVLVALRSNWRRMLVLLASQVAPTARLSSQKAYP